MPSTKASGLKKVVDNSKTKKEKDALVQSKPTSESHIAEKEKAEVLGPFKDLNQSKVVKCMKDSFGKSIIPLALVGHFLNYVGNHLLFYIF